MNSAEAFRLTGLISPGSLFQSKYLLRLSSGVAAEAVEAIRAQFPNDGPLDTFRTPDALRRIKGWILPFVFSFLILAFLTYVTLASLFRPAACTGTSG